jgi:quinol monooxygenase YgiN
MFIAIAIHHPEPNHVAEFEAHMRLVRDTVADADGLLSFECCRDEATGHLLGISRWDSREAFETALPLIAANADRRRDEWTVAEDELRTLDSF